MAGPHNIPLVLYTIIFTQPIRINLCSVLDKLRKPFFLAIVLDGNNVYDKRFQNYSLL